MKISIDGPGNNNNPSGIFIKYWTKTSFFYQKTVKGIYIFYQNHCYPLDVDR